MKKLSGTPCLPSGKINLKKSNKFHVHEVENL